MKTSLVIFDFDGTLMDTRKTIIAAKQKTMRELGLPVKDEQICASTIGLSSYLAFQYTYPQLTEEQIGLCVKTYRKNFEEIKEIMTPELFSGVREALNRLKKEGILLTIATSRNKDSLLYFLQRMEINGYFDLLVASDDTILLKPNPDPVYKIQRDLSVPEKQMLVVGDMPFDIQMGKRAGTYTCGVTYGNSDRKELLDAGADFVIDQIGEMFEVLSVIQRR